MVARHTALMFLGLTALVASGCPNKQDTVDFEVRRPDPARVQDQIEADNQLLGEYKPPEQAQRVIKFFKQSNLHTVSVEPVPPAELEKGLLNLRMAAKRLLLEHGQKATTQLGLHLLAGFDRELDALAKATRGVDGAAVALLSGAPPPQGIRQAYEKFANFGGGFLVLAAGNGLVGPGPDGMLVISEADRFFVRLAFKVYWAMVQPEGTDALEWVLTEFERGWYEIWVVERSRTATLVRKQAALRYLSKHNPDYPARRAQGIILYQHKHYTKAVQAFEQAIKDHPGDEQAERFLAAAKRKAR